jgi:hypothetical protein
MRRDAPLYVQMKQRRAAHASSANSGLLLVLFGFLLVALAIGLTKVYLERRAFQMGLEWESVNRQLSKELNAFDNLRLEREAYTKGSWILPRAEAMGLRPTAPGQVRRLWRPPPGDRLAVVVAQRMD